MGESKKKKPSIKKDLQARAFLKRTAQACKKKVDVRLSSSAFQSVEHREVGVIFGLGYKKMCGKKETRA